MEMIADGACLFSFFFEDGFIRERRGGGEGEGERERVQSRLLPELISQP